MIRRPTITDIRIWVEASAANGIRSFAVADYQLSKQLRTRHIRSGKIEKGASKEGAGVAVVAYGFDVLGNVCALCADGFSRQFLGR